MNLLSRVSPPKLPPLFSPGSAGPHQPDRIGRICRDIAGLLAFLVVPAQAELPEPGRYVGRFGEEGRVSYVINGSKTRIHSIQCSYIATSPQAPSSGTAPEKFPISFSSGKRDFWIYDSNSFRFSVYRNDPKTRTYFSFAIRQKRRGVHRGFVQAYQRFSYQVIDPTSGELETFNSVQSHYLGAIYFEAKLRR